MTDHDFTQGAPRTLEADALADAQVDAQLGRTQAASHRQTVDDRLGLTDSPEDDPTDLAAIAAELAKPVETDEDDRPLTITLDVEMRPGWSVEYDITFTSRDVAKIRRNCKDREFEDGIDGVKFSSLLLAKTSRQVFTQGRPVPLESGRAATFVEPEFLDLFKRDTDRGPIKAVDGVQRLYVLEGHVEGAAKALMRAAGWGDDARESGPTR
jgi:hypothetical protein